MHMETMTGHSSVETGNQTAQSLGNGGSRAHFLSLRGQIGDQVSALMSSKWKGMNSEMMF